MTKNFVRFARYLRNRACIDCHLVETYVKTFSIFQNLDFPGGMKIQKLT